MRPKGVARGTAYEEKKKKVPLQNDHSRIIDLLLGDQEGPIGKGAAKTLEKKKTSWTRERQSEHLYPEKTTKATEKDPQRLTAYAKKEKTSREGKRF